MKKVLALVLAVIMVCTMAMAITITGNTPADAGTTDFVDNAKYDNITPGAQIEFDVADLYYTADENNPYYFPAYEVDGKFIPAKNTVKVNFVSGKELVASEGWVKTGAGNGTGDYKYIIKLVDKEVLLDNAADIVIDKITVSKFGSNATVTYKYVDASGKYAYSATSRPLCLADTYAKDTDTFDSGVYASKFDFGYVPAKVDLNANSAGILTTTLDPASGTTYIAKVGAKDGKTNSKAVFAQAGTSNATGYTTVAMYSNTNLAVGDQFHVTEIANVTGKALTKLNQNVADNDATIILGTYETGLNKAINKATSIAFDNAKESYKLYTVNNDGTVTLVPTTWNESTGILSANVTTYGRMILVDGTLTATGTTTTPGTTTTNPGTGANDVVGVAAALAVVALVSGAAISLKK